MTTLNVDLQRINFSVPGSPSATEARATLILPNTVISAVDLTKAYGILWSYHTGSYRCQGVNPFDGSFGSSCSSIAVPPLPGPIGIAGDLGVMNDGSINQWRMELTGPTTAVIERFGSPTPLPGAADGTDGCGHFFVTHILEYQ